MNYEESHKILNALAEGVDPDSYAPIPQDSVLQRPSYIRAFFTASRALEQFVAQERRRSKLPTNTGKPWTEEQDEQLAQAFDQQTPVRTLAQDHCRTIGSIRARLIKLGKISETDELF